MPSNAKPPPADDGTAIRLPSCAPTTAPPAPTVRLTLLYIVTGDHAPQDNAAVRWLKSRLRLTETLEGEAFFVKRNGLVYATPLFLALIMVETADLIFAVDSVPAVFAITSDPFLVYTSNIFAILGLRALYFALAAILHRFAYLKYALSVLLIFIGSKMFIADWLDWEKFPASLSLGVTALILTTGVAISLWKTRSV